MLFAKTAAVKMADCLYRKDKDQFNPNTKMKKRAS